MKKWTRGPKKIFVIDSIFIYTIIYAHLLSVLTYIYVNSKLINPSGTFFKNKEIFPKLVYMKLKILNFIFCISKKYFWYLLK